VQPSQALKKSAGINFPNPAEKKKTPPRTPFRLGLPPPTGWRAPEQSPLSRKRLPCQHSKDDGPFRARFRRTTNKNPPPTKWKVFPGSLPPPQTFFLPVTRSDDFAPPPRPIGGPPDKPRPPPPGVTGPGFFSTGCPWLTGKKNPPDVAHAPPGAPRLPSRSSPPRPPRKPSLNKQRPRPATNSNVGQVPGLQHPWGPPPPPPQKPPGCPFLRSYWGTKTAFSGSNARLEGNQGGKPLKANP